jgi:signal transduction histidine kinase
MSDIVWAVNPGRDRLSDLSQRMRRHASDVLTAHGAELSFEGPAPGRDVRLGPETRREVYLIFKEALNNIVRHSNCGAVSITFLISAGTLALSLSDDGRGFDPASNGDGNGLANMRQRGAKLGGELLIDSNVGRGTTVKLTVPLDGRRWLGLGFRRRGGRP